MSRSSTTRAEATADAESTATTSTDAAHGYRVEYRKVRDRIPVKVLYYAWFIISVPYVAFRLAFVNWHSWLGPLALLLDLLALALLITFNITARTLFVPVHRPVGLSRFVVDCLIPTHQEQVALIEPTILAAKKIRGVRRVVVAANFERAEVRELCARLGVHYTARGSNDYAKAGNLNSALQHTDAEFIVVLDADHLARPELLERMMGYFDDQVVAYVQAPQTYYNTESLLFRRMHGVDAGWTELQSFYHCAQLAHNRHGAPIFVGCTAVLRRAALDEVGGFAQGTPTEDIHTSLRLYAKGWRGVFTPEPLAFGLEAANLKEFHEQRHRWAAGNLNLLFLSPDSPLRARGLGWAPRIHWLYAICIHLGGLVRLGTLALPLVVLFTLQNPVSVSYGFYGPLFAGWLILTIALAYAHGRGSTHLRYGDAYAFGSAVATATGTKGIFLHTRHFVSSRKLTLRADSHRVKWVLWALLAATVAAVVRGCYLLASTGGSALVAWSLFFAVFNGVPLATFLIYLVRFERRPVVAPHAELEGEDKYEYVMRRFAAGEIGPPRALLERPLVPTSDLPAAAGTRSAR